MKFALFSVGSMPGGFEAREDKKPIGRDTEAYQDFLAENRATAVMADEVGFDAMMFSEHHFHSEGYEAATNPLMLIADLLPRTKRIKFAPLGVVLPTHDPIRLAEDIAIVDNMAAGRFALGIARGYQSRWVQTLSQKIGGAPPSTSDGSPSDLENREAFNEILKIMKMAWTQDTVRYHSDVLDYSIPYPQDGIQWVQQEWTEKYGAEGELNGDGEVEAISIVPKPYSSPHPEIWYPFALSEKTLVECAANDAMPWTFLPRPDKYKGAVDFWQAESAKHGRNYAPGEKLGTLRYFYIGETQEEADKLGVEYVQKPWQAYYERFGYQVVLRMPEDEEKWPDQPLPTEENTWERFKTVTLGIGGTVDDVKRGIDDILKIAEPEWMGWMLTPGQGFIPTDVLLRQIELFGEHIIPEFSDTLGKPDETVATVS